MSDTLIRIVLVGGALLCVAVVVIGWMIDKWADDERRVKPSASWCSICETFGYGHRGGCDTKGSMSTLPLNEAWRRPHWPESE